MKNSIIVTSLVLILPAACGPAGDKAPPAGAVTGAIVNGDVETGWPAVGAIVIDAPYYGYMGSMCSGTLIAPRWVLTAAHCVSSYEGMPMMAFFMKFYVGNDARDSGFGGPAEGDLYQVDSLFPYPGYDPNSLSGGNDLGLIKLEKDVTGVEPVDINTMALRGSDLDRQVLYVGFGTSNGKTGKGSGVKRSTHMPITWIENEAYYTEPQGSGTCHGDSGGPGLLEMAPGQWKAMGIVSAGTEPPGSVDPCLAGFGIYTRVDAYSSWIAEVTGIHLPDCSDGSECVCGDACMQDGSCDNSLCYTQTCTQALGCVSRCGDFASGCVMDCRMGAAGDARVDLDKLTYCLDNHCASADDVLACAEQSCGSNIDACLADAAPVDDCPAYDECVGTCPDGGTLCARVCELQAEAPEREAWVAAADCLEQQCGLGTGIEDRTTDCARDSCAGQVDACFPVPACNEPGGSCPDGTSCETGADGNAECVQVEEPDDGGACATGDACGPSGGGDGAPGGNSFTSGNGCSTGSSGASSPWALALLILLTVAAVRFVGVGVR